MQSSNIPLMDFEIDVRFGGDSMGWRERFREDNELLLRVVGHPWAIRIYLYTAVLTAARQSMYRWEHCSGYAQLRTVVPQGGHLGPCMAVLLDQLRN
jgi:hypothetical protein